MVRTVAIQYHYVEEIFTLDEATMRIVMPGGRTLREWKARLGNAPDITTPSTAADQAAAARI